MVKLYNYFTLINYLFYLIDQGETYNRDHIEKLLENNDLFEWLSRTYPFRRDIYSNKPRIDMSIFTLKKMIWVKKAYQI